MPPIEKIGFIGLGTMGKPMCLRLVAAGYEVTGYDIAPGPLEQVVEAGVVAGANSAEVAGHADLLLTSLNNPDQVATVMEDSGALAALQPGSMWVDLSTSRRELIQRLSDEAPEGVSVADAPLTGAVDGARNGRLTIFIGGAEATVARATPVLEHLGQVIACGPLGTGNVVKLVTNQLWFVAAAAIGEGFALGVKNGVELGVLWEAITNSVGDSFVARHDAPSIFAGHYDPSFTLDLCTKDLDLITELSKGLGTDLPMTEAAQATFARATKRYGGTMGELHVVKRIEDDAEVSFRMPGDWTPPWEQ